MTEFRSDWLSVLDLAVLFVLFVLFALCLSLDLRRVRGAPQGDNSAVAPRHHERAGDPWSSLDANRLVAVFVVWKSWSARGHATLL